MCISPDPSFARGVCLHQTMYKLNLYDGHFVDEEEEVQWSSQTMSSW